MAGRPSKLTPEVQERICNAIRAGNYYEASCAYAGVDYTTFRLWMQKGEKAKSGKFFDFFDAVTKAQADAEVFLVANWKKHVPEDWRAAKEMLARRFPERWGPKDKIDITSGDEKIDGFTVVVRNSDDA